MRLHWIVGGLGLIAFVLQGQYLAHVVGPLEELADGQRMLYRSGHIYLMLASVLNLAMVRMAIPAGGWPRRLFQISSVIVLVAPIVLIAGFFIEPVSGSFDRPISRAILYLIFGIGVVWAVMAPRQRD
ncbi:MAG: hypothetical protein AAGH76_17985 [Pseudomonadota bacterium]